MHAKETKETTRGIGRQNPENFPSGERLFPLASLRRTHRGGIPTVIHPPSSHHQHIRAFRCVKSSLQQCLSPVARVLLVSLLIAETGVGVESISERPVESRGVLRRVRLSGVQNRGRNDRGSRREGRESFKHDKQAQRFTQSSIVS